MTIFIPCTFLMLLHGYLLSNKPMIFNILRHLILCEQMTFVKMNTNFPRLLAFLILLTLWIRHNESSAGIYRYFNYTIPLSESGNETCFLHASIAHMDHLQSPIDQDNTTSCEMADLHDMYQVQIKVTEDPGITFTEFVLLKKSRLRKLRLLPFAMKELESFVHMEFAECYFGEEKKPLTILMNIDSNCFPNDTDNGTIVYNGTNMVPSVREYLGRIVAINIFQTWKPLIKDYEVCMLKSSNHPSRKSSTSFEKCCVGQLSLRNETVITICHGQAHMRQVVSISVVIVGVIAALFIPLGVKFLPATIDHCQG